MFLPASGFPPDSAIMVLGPFINSDASGHVREEFCSRETKACLANRDPSCMTSQSAQLNFFSPTLNPNALETDYSELGVIFINLETTHPHLLISWACT